MSQWKVLTRYTSLLPDETWTVESWKQKHLIDTNNQAFLDSVTAHGADNNLLGTSPPVYELVDNVMYNTKYFASKDAYEQFGLRIRKLQADLNSGIKSYPFTRDIIDQREVD